MQLVRGLHNLQPQARGCVVTIGNFDGVHRGHQAILARLRERAAELAVPSCVVIFEPQPREFFGPDTAPARLTRLRDKLALLAAEGVDLVLCLAFNRRLRELSAAEFVQRVLVDGLRVKDLDCERRELTVRDGKGGNDRRTMLPLGVGERLREQLREGKRLHEKDLADGYGRVQRPEALSRKYRHADREWNWQGVFPQHQRWRNDETGEQGRHHLDPSLVQQAIRRAVMAAAISKPAPPTAFANPLPPISWNGGMTSARFRNCSAKATSGPQ